MSNFKTYVDLIEQARMWAAQMENPELSIKEQNEAALKAASYLSLAESLSAVAEQNPNERA
jgi:aminoglycoside phosphotransferase family enzyme